MNQQSVSLSKVNRSHALSRPPVVGSLDGRLREARVTPEEYRSKAKLVEKVGTEVFDEPQPTVWDSLKEPEELSEEADTHSKTVEDALKKANLNYVAKTREEPPREGPSSEAVALIAAIEAANNRRAQTEVDFCATRDSTVKNGEKKYRRKGVCVELSGRVDEVIKLTKWLFDFPTYVRDLVHSVLEKVRDFANENQELPYDDIFHGAYETDKANEIFDQLELVLAIDDVSDSFLSFKGMLYVFYDGSFGECARTGTLTDSLKFALMRRFRKPIYWGQGRPGRWLEHEGYALGHERARAKKRASPKTTSKHILWLADKFEKRTDATRILIFQNRHPVLCCLAETAMIHFLRGDNNVADGLSMETLAPELAQTPGELPILKFLAAYTFSKLVNRKWVAMATVSQEEAKLTRYPLAYFTHMRGHKKADVTNELLSPADMAKRTVKINFGERLGATTDSLVPRVLRDELKANNGAILESEFVCAMVRRDPKVTILGTHYLFRKYVEYLRHRVAKCKDVRVNDKVISFRGDRVKQNNQHSKNTLIYRTAKYIAMYLPYCRFTVENVFSAFTLHENVQKGDHTFMKSLRRTLVHLGPAGTGARHRNFLARDINGIYMTADFKTGETIKSDIEFVEELDEKIKQLALAQRRCTTRSIVDGILEQDPNFLDAVSSMSKKRARVYLRLKKLSEGSNPVLSREVGGATEGTFVHKDHASRPPSRPLRPGGRASYWEPLDVVMDALANAGDRGLTEQGVFDALVEAYDLESQDKLFTVFGNFTFAEWRVTGRLSYDRVQQVYTLNRPN